MKFELIYDESPFQYIPDNDVTFCCRSLITTLELQHATIFVTVFLIGSRFYGLRLFILVTGACRDAMAWTA
ncbi:hypothetical protein [Aeromonas dhakensis]|uniref:hypothetical protein n=1 Tax=Aeromonas dhakensis TaxID=196024 RepID=UPI0038D04FAB